MINPREKICCESKINDLKYGVASTGCCPLPDDKSVLFNTKHELCCFGGVRQRVIEFAVYGDGEYLHEKEKAEERSRCCNRQAYDTKYQICCRGRVNYQILHLSIPYYLYVLYTYIPYQKSKFRLMTNIFFTENLLLYKKITMRLSSIKSIHENGIVFLHFFSSL